MTSIRPAFLFSCLRLLVAVIGMTAAWAMPAHAETLRLDGSLCHAVTERQREDASLSSLRFACQGSPADYQQGSLWLRADLNRARIDRHNLVLLVQNSRFERLAVAFSYADGVVRWQQVRSGNFALHWRAGGQIDFEAPDRDAPLVAVTMRFDKVASHNLLHARLVTRGESGVRSAALAASIGVALTLLLVGFVYNMSLAVAVRRQFLAWHGAWAACMLLWGAIWSQLPLIVVPAMAGTISAQICTFLACSAVALATMSVATSLGRTVLPHWARVTMLALGLAIFGLGIPLALVRSAAIEPLAAVVNVLILADLLVVACSLAWAWRRGSTAAHDFAGAWSVPMATLAFTQFVNVDTALWDGGAKLVVLFAAAWQTLWLSVAATRRLALLRIERDHARTAEAQAQELARRDPLTGLRNRRGFVEAIAPLLDQGRSEGRPVALLLIDIDRFKVINDAHGHEAGDLVLQTIAGRLERWESPMCAVARLGGEEFALMIAGLDGFTLARFCDSVLLELAACDHKHAIGTRAVTVSIGVAETHAARDFQQLYGLADEALYAAKREGRNRVALRLLDGIPAQPPERPGPLVAHG
jgi:diguanylate cyclase (GGDEF)-like protein